MLGPETTAFLRDLAANNTRDWFESNRVRYRTVFQEPAKGFAAALETLLSARYGVAAMPKIYRIHRDLRFSRDKTPFNAHLHIGMADPETGAAWMVGLETDRFVVGYGLFAFEGKRLEDWRDKVASDRAAQLLAAIGELTESGVRLDPPELKRVPAPYDADHPAAELLRRKSLAAWRDLQSDDAYGEAAPARIVEQLAAFDGIRNWLKSNLA